MMAVGTVIKADRDEDYLRFGVDRLNISASEDGRRLELASENFEWWYFDAILEDKTIVCLALFINHYIFPLVSPIVGLSIKLANEEKTRSVLCYFPGMPIAQTNNCDVKIGVNSFVGDLSTCAISVSVDELSVDVALKRTTNDPPPIRVGTGYLLFEKDGKESLFGWLAAFPSGQAHVKYRIGGTEYESKGYGYHDHNWGNSKLQKLVSRWYWAKARVDQYTVVAAAFSCSPDYGSTQIHQLTIADGANVIFESGTDIAFSTGATSVDPVTHIPIPEFIRFGFQLQGLACSVTFSFQETIRQLSFTGNGGYCRFLGKVEIVIPDSNGTTQTFNGSGLWELMWPSAIVDDKSRISAFQPVHI
jgi:hypothetical protein